jgi:pilus assembly protein CpaC
MSGSSQYFKPRIHRFLNVPARPRASVIFFVLLIGALVSPEARGEEPLILAPGRSANWTPPAGSSLAISNGAVIKANDKGAFVQIVGKKVGTAVLRANGQQTPVAVLPEAAFQTYVRLKNRIATKRGLTVNASGGLVTVNGRLLRLDDWLDLGMEPVSQNGGFHFAATMDDSLAQRAKEYFTQLMTQSGLPDLSIQVAPAAIVSIPKDSKDLEDQVFRVLGSYGFQVEKSSATLGLQPLVRVQILLAEVRKKALKRLGIEWPDSVSGQILPSLAAPLGGQIQISLNAIEENGLGKILASPTLLCRSGKSAEFLAGGEFPIRVANRKTKDIVWKRHGVLLKISPQADFSGRMSIGITTEVSMIDNSQKVDGIPGLITNRIDTHFDLSGARTIALSGLIKREWGEASRGLPGLSTLPVIGALFGSHEYQDNQTELIAFVTPEVLKPGQEEK